MMILRSYLQKPLNWLLFFVLIGLQACGIRMQEAALYDGYEPAPNPAKPATIALIVEPVIFEEDGTNFWVSDDPNCTTGSVTTEAVHSGEYALKVNWDRDPAACEWAGFGIGWEDWAGKDLTDLYDYGAIQMYVRSQEGKMFGLPMVLTLEDYSGHMAWSYTTNKYFERYYIDEEWQKVVVPLNSFDLEEDGLDIGNIKQLMFELQQGGGIYLDDLRIVFYEPKPVDPYLPEEKMPEAPTYPIQLFSDSFIDGQGWGLLSDACQQITLSRETTSEGNTSIHAVWDDSVNDCYQIAMGVSWNNWHPVDLSDRTESLFIELDVRNGSGTTSSLPVQIGLEDYERNTSFAVLEGSYSPDGGFSENWQTVRIPISALTGNANLTDVKQLLIRMEGSGDIYLDNLRLVSK